MNIFSILFKPVFKFYLVLFCFVIAVAVAVTIFSYYPTVFSALVLLSFLIYIFSKNSKLATQKRGEERDRQVNNKAWDNLIKVSVGEMPLLEEKIAHLDEDYLALLIDRVGDDCLASLNTFPPLSDMVAENASAINNFKYLTEGIDDLNVLKNRFNSLLASAERQDLRSLTPDQINALNDQKLQYENALIVLNEASKLKALLSVKGINLKYWQLIWLLQEKLSERRNETMSKATHELRSSLETMIPIILVEHNLNKDNEGVATALAIARQLLFSSTPNAVAGHIVLENMLPSLLRKYSAYANPLSEIQIKELLSNAHQNWEATLFEKELKAARKVEILKLSDMENASGEGFEILLEKLFRHLGYSVIRTPLTGDQGADLVLEKDGVRTAVQAKRYQGTVSNKAVQEVAAASKHYNCEKGMVVTTAQFTKSAKELALSNNVELWGYSELKAALARANT